ncbi:MAG: Bifunctional protein PyrR [Deltaproteobacteria bacterium ADurb.Bin510]|nr:MAG: Bifunctional protein PyrR [Deltaproteobacteria bacterium ADurb.Bin510]
MANIPQSEAQIEALLEELVASLGQSFDTWDKVAFVGVRSGGELLARQLVKRLGKRSGANIPLGLLDISFYRDDLSKRLFSPEVKNTEIDFAIDDQTIILVDDVLNTGRTVRAAIDHLMDLGRPKRIMLLVLFDRGGRELPFQADFVGARIDLPDDKRVKLKPVNETFEVVIKEARP